MSLRSIVTGAALCFALIVGGPHAAQATTLNEAGLSFSLPDDFELKKETMRDGRKITMAGSNASKVGVVAWPVSGTAGLQNLVQELNRMQSATLEGVNCGAARAKKQNVNGIPLAYYACGARSKKGGESMGVQVNLYANAATKQALVMVVFWSKSNAAQSKPIIASIIGSVKRQ